MRLRIFVIIITIIASLIFIPLLDTGSVPYVYGYENLIILMIGMFDLFMFGSLFF